MKKTPYDIKEIESNIQEKWNKAKLYSPDIESIKDDSQTFYNLWMFPYPSAEGLHAGHAYASTGSDVYGRFMRMHRKSVFQPIGYDSFGIHSENYAIKVGESPETMVQRTTTNYARQLSSLGHGYDWSRTLATSDPEYYKWTQWIFTMLFKAGHAYRKKAEVNWCPSCKTVLADEQVIDGKCERCGTVVTRKSLAQWFFRITDNADRLLENLETIDWPQKVKSAQKQWIGKSVGLDIHFKIKEGSDIIVWTKYWETIFGATFIVVSPEYLISSLAHSASKEAVSYAHKALEKTTDERRTVREKTGVNTGLIAINPAIKQEIQVWVADYVIDGVGTGAVMGVPAHDERDFEFAQKYGLQSITVINDVGELVSSGSFDTLKAEGEGKEKIQEWIMSDQLGAPSTHYHLRDWLISRQRYWGPPIPMIYCETCAKNGKGWFTTDKEKVLHADQTDWDSEGWYPVDETSLPVLLPKIADYKPKGEGSGPLADHPEFYETTCPGCSSPARRETDICDTFLDSSWYFLRYPSTGFENVPFDSEITRTWLPVNLYFGGAEHAVLHLMYARYVTHVLFDLQKLTFEEPFPRFYAHGLMVKDGAKMSKSRGNVVNPDQYIEKFGADTLRLYLMFMGPMDGSPDFRDTGIEGMQRFVFRLWDLLHTYESMTLDSAQEQNVRVRIQKAIKKITNDVELYKYNTAIATMMELTTFLEDVPNVDGDTHVWNESLVTLAQLLAPFAPHMTDYLWSNLFKKDGSIHVSEWPVYDAALTIEETFTIPVQVNGKHRGQISVEAVHIKDIEYIQNLAAQEVSKWIDGQSIKKHIYVEGRIINLIV